MSETGDFELFSAPAAKEHDEKADEAFREQMKQTQMAMKQLQQEEGKARGHDDKLAQIIMQFLSRAGGTELFLLISRCVAQDIPSELIIAVLALVDLKASEEVKNLLKDVKVANALMVPSAKDVPALHPHQKQAIDIWIRNIYITASHKPHHILDAVVIKSVVKATGEIVREIAPPLVQLSAFIMRDFLAKEQTTMEYQTIRDFLENIYFLMVQDLESLIQEQRQIQSA